MAACEALAPSRCLPSVADALLQATGCRSTACMHRRSAPGPAPPPAAPTTRLFMVEHVEVKGEKPHWALSDRELEAEVLATR